MLQLLLVSRLPERRKSWRDFFSQADFSLYEADQPAEILRLPSGSRPDLAVLDGEKGSPRPEELREALQRRYPGWHCPIVWALSQKQAATLEPGSGFDDFALLESGPEELMARVRLCFWRTRGMNARQQVQVGNLTIDQSRYEVVRDGQPLRLTGKEFQLLCFLATHRGRVFTREALLDQVWGYDTPAGHRTVDVFIRRLRAKLGPEYEDRVETIRHVGYRFA